MPIIRDRFGIVVQHRPDDPLYLDGGDSARVTGLLSMCGSVRDQFIITNFVKHPGNGVRHPFQDLNNNNNPNNFTRDQLICLMAGLSTSFINSIFAETVVKSYAKRLFLGQNTHDQENNKKPWYKGRDILHPGYIGFLIQAAQMRSFYFILPFTWLFILLELLFSVFITPWRESNQTIALLNVSGKWFLKLYTKLHPDWKKPIIDYWSGWRDQKEIAEIIINYVLTRTQ